MKKNKIIKTLLIATIFFLFPQLVEAGDFNFYLHIPNLEQQNTLKQGEVAEFVVVSSGTNYVNSTMDFVYDENKLELLSLVPYEIFKDAKVGDIKSSPVSIQMGNANTNNGIDLFKVTFKIKEKSSSPANFKINNVKNSSGGKVDDFSHDIHFYSPSSANKMTSLGISDGLLLVDFSPDILEYQLVVASDTTSVNFTAIGENDLVTFEGLGMVTIEGKDTLTIKAIAENKEERIYYFKLVRGDVTTLDSNNYLKMLIPSAGHLLFSSNKTDYEVEVPYNISEFFVRGIPISSKAVVNSQGLDHLNVGVNTIIVTVTAYDGTVREYTIRVVRKDKSEVLLNDVKTLNRLDIEGYSLPFKRGIVEYTLVVRDFSPLVINALPEFLKAKVSIQGNEDLVEGSEIVIIVTAENGENQEYKIKVVKDNSKKGISGFTILGIIVIMVQILVLSLLVFLKIRKRKNV